MSYPSRDTIKQEHFEINLTFSRFFLKEGKGWELGSSLPQDFTTILLGIPNFGKEVSLQFAKIFITWLCKTTLNYFTGLLQ